MNESIRMSLNTSLIPPTYQSIDHPLSVPINITLLILTFLPVFVFHTEEKYMPASMEYAFQNAQLYNGTTMIADYGQITPEMLEQNKGHRIQLHPDAIYGEKNKSLSDIPVYVKVKENEMYYEITYVIYFTYSGPYHLFLWSYGHHDSDLEHVSVRILKSTGQVIGVYFSYHSDGTWRGAGEYDTVNNTHPVAYVAKSSHGIYPYTGTRCRIYGFANDTMNDGIRWLPQKIVRIDTPDAPYWMKYRGQLSMDGVDNFPLKGWIKGFEPDFSTTEIRDCCCPLWYPRCILCIVPFGQRLLQLVGVDTNANVIPNENTTAVTVTANPMMNVTMDDSKSNENSTLTLSISSSSSENN